MACRTRAFGVIRGDRVALRAGRALVSPQRGAIVAVVAVRELVPGRKVGVAGAADIGGHLLCDVIERRGAIREVGHVARLAHRRLSAYGRVLHRRLGSPGNKRRMAGRAGRREFVGDMHGRGAGSCLGKITGVASLALGRGSTDGRVAHHRPRPPGSEGHVAALASVGEHVGDVHGRWARCRHHQGSLVTTQAIWWRGERSVVELRHSVCVTSIAGRRIITVADHVGVLGCCDRLGMVMTANARELTLVTGSGVAIRALGGRVLRAHIDREESVILPRKLRHHALRVTAQASLRVPFVAGHAGMLGRQDILSVFVARYTGELLVVTRVGVAVATLGISVARSNIYRKELVRVVDAGQAGGHTRRVTAKAGLRVVLVPGHPGVRGVGRRLRVIVATDARELLERRKTPVATVAVRGAVWARRNWEVLLMPGTGQGCVARGTAIMARAPARSLRGHHVVTTRGADQKQRQLEQRKQLARTGHRTPPGPNGHPANPHLRPKCQPVSGIRHGWLTFFRHQRRFAFERWFRQPCLPDLLEALALWSWSDDFRWFKTKDVVYTRTCISIDSTRVNFPNPIACRFDKVAESLFAFL